MTTADDVRCEEAKRRLAELKVELCERMIDGRRDGRGVALQLMEGREQLARTSM
jgi:hypothetical protein